MYRRKICPRCCKTFVCMLNRGCFCDKYQLTEERKNFLASNYNDCLCEECLKEFASTNNSAENFTLNNDR